MSSPAPRNDIFVIDPVAMTSIDISSGVHGKPPVPRVLFGSTAVGGKLYIMGGYSGSGISFSP
jgi:hypothetical protein